MEGKQRGLSVTEQGKWQIIHGLPKSVEAPSAPALLNTVPSVCIWHLRDVCLEIPLALCIGVLSCVQCAQCEKNLWVRGNPDANLLYSSEVRNASQIMLDSLTAKAILSARSCQVGVVLLMQGTIMCIGWL